MQFNLKEIHKDPSQGAKYWLNLIAIHDHEKEMAHCIDKLVRYNQKLTPEQYKKYDQEFGHFFWLLLALAGKLQEVDVESKKIHGANFDLLSIRDLEKATIFHYYAIGQTLQPEEQARFNMLMFGRYTTDEITPDNVIKDIKEVKDIHGETPLHYLAYGHCEAAIQLMQQYAFDSVAHKLAARNYARAGKIYQKDPNITFSNNSTLYHTLALYNDNNQFDFATVAHLRDKYDLQPKDYIPVKPSFLPDDKYVNAAFRGDLYFVCRAKENLAQNKKFVWHALAANRNNSKLLYSIIIGKQNFKPEANLTETGASIWHTMAENKANHPTLELAAKAGFLNYETCLDNAGNPVPLPFYMDVAQPIKLKQGAALPAQPNVKPAFIKSGMDHKYIDVKLPELPSKPEKARKNKYAYEHSFAFTYIKDLKPADATSMEIVRNEYKISNELCDLVFYSTREELKSIDKVIFVHAGRKEDALVPLPDATCRVVIVATMAEYQSYKDKLNSSNLDVLVINKLTSKTHGDYKDALGSINARRLAVLLFSFERKLTTCLCLDDNLEEIKGAQNPTNLYANFEKEISTGNKPVLAGMASYTNCLKANYDQDFCSKAHFWDLATLFKIIKKPEHLFYFAFPAKDSYDCAEDYWQQLMLYYLFHAYNKKAYQVTDPQIMVLVRATQHKRAFQKTGKMAGHLLEPGVLEFTNKADHDPDMLALAENACTNLKQIVRDNIDGYNKALEKIVNANLLKEHARANDIEYTDLPTVPLATGPFGTLWLAKLQANLEKIGFLRPYQKQAIAALLTSECSMSKFLMATGTGKTVVQMTLATHALAVNSGKPIIIVTPSMQLVQQFFDDFKDYHGVIRHFMPNLFHMQQVIMVDSDSKHTSAELLKINKSTQNQSIVYIFCLDSYMRLFKDKKDNYLKNAALLLLDEYHKYPANQLSEIAANAKSKGTLVYGFTATPPKLEADIFKRAVFKYTRKQAETDGYIVPLIVHKLAMSHNSKIDDAQRNTILDSILQIPHNGGTLDSKKVVIYLPLIKNIHSMFDYLKTKGYAAHVLDKSATEKTVYQVHSGSGSPKDSLAKFMANTNACICLACGQLRIGFNDVTVDAAAILQSAKDQNDVTQIAGRVLRKNPQNPDKKGLLVVYKNADLTGLDLDVDPPTSPLLFIKRTNSNTTTTSTATPTSRKEQEEKRQCLRN